MGAISGGLQRLRLIARFSRAPAGGYHGTLDSIDQGAGSIEIASAAVEGLSVRFELSSPAALYAGEMSGDGSVIRGEWSQGGMTAPLTFRRQSAEPNTARPQDPRPPLPYGEQEVAFRNEQAGLNFAATLTLPAGDGPFPAVILLTGSGPQDRDETIAGHRPFLVLADPLARHGIAVLRADDRGVGGSDGDVFRSTTSDFADDALAGLSYLRSRPEIEHSQIGLLGHSEGASVATLAASRALQSESPAFVALLAPPGIVGSELLLLQAELIGRKLGADASAVVRNQNVQRKIFEAIAAETDNDRATEIVHRILSGEIDSLDQSDASDEDRQYLDLSMKQTIVRPWFRYFLAYDPLPALKQTPAPVLALFGERDLQVPPPQNLPGVEQALEAGGRLGSEALTLPRLNHLMQTSETGSPTEYGEIDETVAPVALEKISSWILERVK